MAKLALLNILEDGLIDLLLDLLCDIHHLDDFRDFPAVECYLKFPINSRWNTRFDLLMLCAAVTLDLEVYFNPVQKLRVIQRFLQLYDQKTQISGR